MTSEKLDKLFMDIKNSCLELIYQKNIDIEELCFKLGVSVVDFINRFHTRDKDFSFYLATYNYLLDW